MLHSVARFPKIENFILIKYRKNTFDAPESVHHKLPTLDKWNELQDTIFEIMLSHLRTLYPDSNVHIITNEKGKDLHKVVYHQDNVEPNWGTKLLVYGLLDVPAMYLDTDILLLKPFEEEHLITSAPFNLYEMTSPRNLQMLSKKKLEVECKGQFNCGMIWIPKPSMAIVEEMKRIKQEYFNNKKWIENRKLWFHNDEYTATYFVRKYGLKMKRFLGVNVFRSRCKFEEIPTFQSVHYASIDGKQLFLEEYKKL